MTFEEWFEQEGRVMVDGGCSHEVVARAAFFVASQPDHKSDAELSELRQQNAELTAHRDEATARYQYLLHNMGTVEDHATKWIPGKHKPLMNYLHDFIDAAIAKCKEGK